MNSKNIQTFYKEILKNVENKKDLFVTLKRSENKGVGLYAVKTIKKGETVAYYKVKVYKGKDYESPTDSIYLIEIYRKNGEAYKRLIGDIYEESFSQPTDGITYWAPFANEPSKNQRINAVLDINLEDNYVDKRFMVPGDIVIYKLISSKMIRPGEEILWYYGENYQRDYEVGKK